MRPVVAELFLRTAAPSWDCDISSFIERRNRNYMKLKPNFLQFLHFQSKDQLRILIKLQLITVWSSADSYKIWTLNTLQESCRR